MKLLNIKCISTSTTVVICLALLIGTSAVASILTTSNKVEKIKAKTETPWEPTIEDIAFQDSMYAIIERTQLDLDTIRIGIDRILYKLDRFDYPDGTYDSIRYVVCGKIDKLRNK
jgi:hypothetical protein